MTVAPRPDPSGLGPLKPWQGYAVALAATAATLGLRLALDGRLGGRPTLVIFTLPIVLSAYLGGLGPGLLATALSYFAASYSLLPPLHGLFVASGVERWQQGFLALAGVVISALNEALHRARRRAIIATHGHRQAEERMRTAVKDTGDLRAALDQHASVAITDPLGKITFVNDRFCALSKYLRAELLGQDHRIVNSGFHSKTFIRDLWTTIARGHVWQGDIKNRAKDGSFHWMNTTIVPSLDADGRPRQYVAIRADITEQKAAEEARRTSEARYRTLFEYAPDGILIADPESYYLDANPSICRMLGYTRGELIGLHASDIIAQGEIEHVEKALSVIKSRSEYFREWQFRRKDGSVVAAEVIATMMPDGKLLGMVRDITERKRATDALRESEVRLQAVTENLSEGLIIATIDGQLLHWNRAGLEMHGYRSVEDGLHKLTEFTRTFAFTTLDGTTLGFEHWPLNRVLRGETVRDLELHVRRLDIDWERLFSYSGEVVRDATGKPLAFLTITDITVRKQTEAALREREAQLHASDRRLAEIVHGMTEACFALDAQWLFTFVNDRSEALFHGRRETMLGRSLWEVFHELVGTPTEAHYRRAMAERVPVTFETFSSVAERWLDVRLFPTGEGLAAFLLDIQPRKLAEAEVHELNADLEQRVVERTRQLEVANADLRHSRAQLNSLFESLPGLYLVLTPDLRIVAASDAYLKATITTREGILGRDLFEVFPDNPEDRDARAVANMRASIDHVVRNAVADTMAIQRHDIRRPDGVFETRYWSPINSPVFGADHQIMYVVHRVEEVTEFVLQSSRPAGVSTELTNRLQQMEAEVFLSSQRLQATNEQLEAANQELEAFSYSVSHDLRGPLRAVDGFSQAVLEDFGPQLPEECRGHLKRIREGAKGMAMLIDDLLSFSQFSRAALNKREVNTDEVVRGVLEDLSAQRAGRSIDLRIEQMPSCVADPSLVKQIWVNLLSNALKYTQKRELAVVEIGCKLEPAGNVYFVRDNGAGFDMSYAHKLFGVFQRLHRAEEYPGTGVGLAIVQRIIQRHGGRIWADAAVDRGATFSFTLEGQGRP